MACRYTYKGKTYEAHQFDDVLRAMRPAEAAKFMPSVSSIPAAPMVTDTKSWTALAMKRAIIEAVDSGADKVAWTTGAQQADRYSLEKQAGGVYYTKDGVGAGTLVVTAVGKTINDTPILEKDNVDIDDIEDYVGKEIADRLLKTTPDKDGFHFVEGDDLKVGGEGMKGFYDDIIPQVARDILKKFGGKLETVSLDLNPSFDKTAKDLMVRINKTSDGRYRAGVGAGDERVAETFDTDAEAQQWAKDQVELARVRPTNEQPGFTITGAMRTKVKAEGLPLFSNQRKQLEATGKSSQTDTPEFKKWFGDSKVVDSDGNPLVVYHSTSAETDFSRFKKRVGDIGNHFGTIGQAEDRGEYINKFGAEYKNPRILPVYLTIKRPLRLTDAGAWNAENLKHQLLDLFPNDTSSIGSRWGKDGLRSTKDIREFIQSKGYDGVVYKNTGETAGADEYRRAVRLAKMKFPASWTGKSSFSTEDQKQPFYIAYREAEDAYSQFREDAAEDSYITFEPTQIKSSIGNNGQFDASNPDIRYSDQRTIGLTSDYTHTQDQLDAFKELGRTTDVPTLKEKVKEVTDGLGARLIQGIFDQFDPIKRLSTDAYRLLRQSKGASGAFEVLLHGGRLKITDGTYDIDDTKMGGVLNRLLKPLQGQHDDFLWWVAANRAKYLKQSERENLFTDKSIKAMLTLANGTLAHDYTFQHGKNKGKTTRLRSEAFADSLITFNEFNKNAMDMAEQSGLIDKDSRKFWETEFYVPFYREMDSEGGVRGMNIKGGIVRQKAFEHLKGGKSKLKSDLLENTLMNWAHLLDAAAKNRAAKASLEAAEVAGVAHKAAPGEKQTVWFMGDVTKTIPMGQTYTENGKQLVSDGTAEITYHGKVEYVVTDPMVMTAIQSLEYAGMNNPIMKGMQSFKHYLTMGVTASPFFKVRNLIRDSIQAVAIAPIGYNVAANLKQGWALTDPTSLAYFHLMAGGGTIHFGTMLEGRESDRIRALTEMGIPRDTILDNEGAMTKMWKRHMEPVLTAYNELGNRGEAINRASMYKQLMDQGMGHGEASLMSRDMMDFSMGGSFATVRFLTQLVPFMNARLQGMYKLGKSMKENPKRFSTVVGACAALSIAMMLAYKDDEDWKKREDWDRDSYWWFKINGIAYRVPKPFEVGAMASVAERTLEYMISDEMNGERLAKRFTSLLSDNLAMNPMPQAFKPLTDVYANNDSFRNSPIETMGMDKLAPSYRYTSRTSMTARALSTAGNAATFDHFLSPVQIDHVIQGYFGWLGATAVATAETVTGARSVMGEPSRPSQDWIKTMSGGMVRDLDSEGSRYVSQVYEQAKEIEQAYSTWSMLNKTGKAEEAEQWKDTHMDELRKYRMVEQVKHAQSEINNQIRVIERSDATPDEKREMIKELRDQKHEIAKQIANIN